MELYAWLIPPKAQGCPKAPPAAPAADIQATPSTSAGVPSPLDRNNPAAPAPAFVITQLTAAEPVSPPQPRPAVLAAPSTAASAPAGLKSLVSPTWLTSTPRRP